MPNFLDPVPTRDALRSLTIYNRSTYLLTRAQLLPRSVELEQSL
jgi:hypothetical protein